MTTEILSSAGVAASGSAIRRSDLLRTLASHVATGLDTWADHWAAAAMYQQLYRLSDAELARRGLARATLARDVAATTPHRDWRTTRFSCGV
jgi:hypothetical protein